MSTAQHFDALDFKFTPRAEYTDDAFCEKAAEVRENATWDEVAKAMGVTRPVASLAAQVHWYGRIAFKTQEELAAAVVKARDEEKQGWATIGARVGGLTEGRVQRLYEQGTGDSYVTSRLARSTRQRTEPVREQGKPAISEADLKAKTVKELRALATEMELDVPDKAKKADLIAVIAAAL